MENERLTPFERIEPQNNNQTRSTSTDSIDQLIFQRKANKKRLKKKIWLRRLGVFVLTLTLSLLSYAYFSTSMSKLQQIELIGNRVLSKQELLDQLSLTISEPLHQIDLVKLNQKINAIDLVKTASVSFGRHNSIRIEVTEKRGVALIMLTSGIVLLTDQAELIEMNAHRYLLNLNLPLVIGIEDAQDITELAQVLGTLNDEILVNISEIHKEKTAFNEAQMRLMMQEGNIVFAPLSALSALDKYLQIIKMTNETNSCFYIADLSFSVIKQTCPTY